MTETQAKSLAEKTVNQKSALWTSQRKLRITSSSAASVPKRQEMDPSKWIKKPSRSNFQRKCSDNSWTTA